MTSVKFQNSLVNDSLRAISLEDAFRIQGNYAGIHDYKFDPLISDDDADQWVPTAGWTFGESVAYTGASAGWSYLWSDADISLSREGIVDLDKLSDIGGVCFRGDAVSSYYLLYWDSDSIEFGKYTDEGYELLSRLPADYTGSAHVRLAYHEASYTSEETDVELVMSAWIDHRHVLTAHDELDINSPPGTRIALVAPADGAAEYANIYVPELSRITNWMTLDPGETPGGGLERAIGQDYNLKYFVRFDGTLRAWKPKEASSVLTLETGDMFTSARRRDWRRIATHIRQIGGWHEVELYRDDLYDDYMHRFEEVTNENLLSEAECNAEGIRALYRAEEEFETINLEGPAVVFLEPEDVVTLGDYGVYIVDGVSARFLPGGIIFVLEARRYVYAA